MNADTRLPVCFSALFNVEPSTMTAGLGPRPFSAYRFMVRNVPGDKLSIRNEGVGEVRLAISVPESSLNTCSMNMGD